eukprot:SAG22_NODE_74_length_22289_cov_65.265119_31_plen_66_part_00
MSVGFLNLQALAYVESDGRLGRSGKFSSAWVSSDAQLPFCYASTVVRLSKAVPFLPFPCRPTACP